MRSKTAQRILGRTSIETKIFVSKYADIVISVKEILEKNGITQENFPNQADKCSSEIYKWLNGEHDFSLRSISKLEAELGETILEVTKSKEEIEKKHTTPLEEIIIKNTITTRKATIEDLENLNLLFDAYRIFYKKESDLESSKQFLRERIENNESELFIATYHYENSDTNSENKLVGFVQLYPIFSSTRLKRFWVLNDLFVDAAFRGKGISVLLIDEAKKLAIQTKSAGLSLETDKNNAEGNNLYPKTGFKLDTEHNFYYWSE